MSPDRRSDVRYAHGLLQRLHLAADGRRAGVHHSVSAAGPRRAASALRTVDGVRKHRVGDDGAHSLRPGSGKHIFHAPTTCGYRPRLTAPFDSSPCSTPDCSAGSRDVRPLSDQVFQSKHRHPHYAHLCHHTKQSSQE